MNSRIYIGEVGHTRHAPVEHAFSFPFYCLGVDLDELEELGRTITGFAHNRRGRLSIRDTDYLDGEKGALKGRLVEWLKKQGFTAEIGTVELVTVPRYFGYVFNPVSFYYCRRPDGGVQCVVAEVNNTFGERHHYILHPLEPGPEGFVARAAHPKQFHVSPFNDMKGGYEFLFSEIREKLDIHVTLNREGRKHFWAGMKGEALPLTPENLARAMKRFPLTPWLTMPRIFAHAAKLYYRKKLRLYHKPPPTSPLTIRAQPNRRQLLAMKLILKFFGKIRSGSLSVTLPDGATRVFGNPAATPRAQIAIAEYDFFTRMLHHGDIGFGESYMRGEWDTHDLAALLSLFALNLSVADDRRILLSWIGRAFNRARHAFRANTLFGSRRNIREHYDLSNDFFKLFLDETMMYSCALYESPGQPSADAQRNKLRALIRKADIGATDHVLEIGSGWGGFAIEAAKSTGCRVTSITLSEEQLKLARERAKEAGVADRVSFELCDYRQANGLYDKIVSIEMLEAVGHEHFGTFFKACDRLLKPGGLVVLQVITIPDQRYDAYRLSSDWIQKHIFPGGVLPSLTALCRAMTVHSRLIVENLENIGPHYAQTLREWRERFVANLAEVEKLGFDREFQRKWIYYFCYCEAGFATRQINDLHLVLKRPGE